MLITIKRQLAGLNEYTKANRANRYTGAKLKSEIENLIMWQLPKAQIKGKVSISIVWYEPDFKRDYDNIVFAKKFIFDALVKKGVIENDSRKFVDRVTETVRVDKANPRIEIEIEECKNGQN